MTEPAGPADGDQTEMVTLSFDPAERLRLKRLAAFERPYAERISLALAIRLLTIAQLDSHYVLDAIDGLEGIRPTPPFKTAARFEHAPLYPLWHQHYVAPRHIVRNIGERWGIARGEGNRDLTNMIELVANEQGHDPDLWPKMLAHLFTDGYFERLRARRLTGDWIIFAVHDGVSYYLDLAKHEEAKPANAASLLKKLRNSASAEFPFAFVP